MKNIPTIDTMLNTIEEVLSDLFLNIDTFQINNGLLFTDGDKVEFKKTLKISNRFIDYTFYVTPLTHRIALTVWDQTEEDIEKELNYYYNDYSLFESLMTKIIMEIDTYF